MGYDGSVKIGTELDKDGFKKGLQGLGSLAKQGFSVLGDAAVSAAKAATTAIAGVSTALGGVAAASATVGMEFEAQMSRVEAISGATEQELAKLEEQAKQLGASTSFSASEAAQGMENLASAGFEVEEIMEAMPGMLDLAASSGEGLAVSADIAASTLRGFGLEASEAGHVADVLAKNAADTNAAVVDTGEAMKYIAPVAHSMGLSLEEVAASIGILADSGIQGSQAGTTLRQALSRLAKPTDAMQDKIDALGISFYDGNGKMKSMSEMVGMLQTSMEGLTDEEKQNALVTLFGQEALSGMMVLMEAGPEKIDSLTESYKNCDGAAAEMATTMLDNLKGAVEELGGAAETFQLELYSHMEQPLKSLAQKGAEYLNELTDAFRENGTEGLVEAGSRIISDVLLGIADALPDIVDTASNIIQTIVDNLNENLPQLLSAGGRILSSLAEGVISVLGSLWELGSNIVNNLTTGLMANMPAISGKAKEILLGFIQSFVDNFPSVVQTGTEILTSIIQGISAMLPELVPAAVNAIVTFADTLLENLPTIIDAGIDLLFSLVEGIVNALPTLIREAPRIINDFWDEFDANLWKIIEAGASLIAKLGKGIIDSIPLILENAGEIVKAIFNTISHLDMLSLGKNLITKLGSGIKGMFNFVKDAAKQIVDKLKHPFGDVKWSDIGHNIISGITSGISNAAGSLVDAAVNAASNAINTVKGWLGIHSPSRRAKKEIGIPLITGAAEGAEDATPEFVKASEESARSAIGAMQDVSASDFVRSMQAESYRKAADNEMSARNRYQNNGYAPDEPDDNGGITINNQFNVDGKPLVDETVKKTRREITREQRSNQAVKGEVAFG